jgi:hypothetical protein
MSMPTPIAHPLPLGTKLRTLAGDRDCGAMSWDANDFEVERIAQPGAVGVVIGARKCPDSETVIYDVVYPDSEVCVCPDSNDLDRPGVYDLIELGMGTVPKITFPGQEDPTRRDPAVVAQIEEALAAGEVGPSV